MPKAQIDRYEQRTMVNGSPLSAPIKPVENNAMAEIANFGRELGGILAKQSDRLDSLKLRNNEEKLTIEVSKMNNELAQAGTAEEFDEIVKKYTEGPESLQKQSENRLGKRLYGVWQEEGNNYMEALKVDIAGKRVALNKKVAFESGKDTSKNMAYLYAYGSDAERKLQDKNFDEFLNNPENNFNTLEKNNLRQTYNHDKEFGYLTQLVNNNPEQAEKLLADKKNFDSLSVAERERFADAAAREIKARKDTILDKGTAGDSGLAEMVRQFNILYEKDPKEAEKFYQSFVDKPTKLPDLYGIKGSNTLMNYMKNVLDEGEYGRQKEQLWADTKVRYQNFDMSDGLISNEDLNNVEDITEMIGVINGGLQDGFYDKHEAEANTMVANLRKNLADMVKEPKIKNTAFWGDTAAESMPKQIKTLLKRDVNGELDDQDIGKIYEASFIRARAEGLNFKSKDTAVKERAAQIIKDVFKRNIRTQYLLDEDEANAVVSEDDNALMEFSDKAKNKGAKKLESGPMTLNEALYDFSKTITGKGQ